MNPLFMNLVPISHYFWVKTLAYNHSTAEKLWENMAVCARETGRTDNVKRQFPDRKPAVCSLKRDDKKNSPRKRDVPSGTGSAVKDAPCLHTGILRRQRVRQHGQCHRKSAPGELSQSLRARLNLKGRVNVSTLPLYAARILFSCPWLQQALPTHL